MIIGQARSYPFYKIYKMTPPVSVIFPDVGILKDHSIYI